MISLILLTYVALQLLIASFKNDSDGGLVGLHSNSADAVILLYMIPGFVGASFLR